MRKQTPVQIPLLAYRTLLKNYLKPQWPGVVFLSVLLFSSIGLELFTPQLLRTFIDSALAGQRLPILLRIALLFLGATLVQQGTLVGTTYLSEQIGWTATNQLRLELTRHCLQLDLPFHHIHPPGELIERLDGDLTTLSNFFSAFVVRLLGSALLLIGVLLALLQEDWRVGLIFICFSLGALIVLRQFRRRAAPFWLAGRQASGILFGFLEEQLAGLKDLRANGASGYSLHRWRQVLQTQVVRQRSARMMSEVISSTSSTLLALGYVGALAFGAALFEGGRITLGAVYLIGYYISLLLTQLRQINLQMDDLQKASASLERVQALFQTLSAVQDGPGAALPAGAPSVEFQHVSFGYTPDHLILHNLSFRLEPGRILGVLGHTGSGKTTLARLLARLYDPLFGQVLLDGVDLRQMRLATLWQHIGLVTQEVQLFHASVRDNLSFFDGAISDEQLIAALNLLGLAEWYEALPVGLATEIGPGGSGLSAGEAQLLTLARLLLKNPSLVILDEASSRLDPVAEHRLEQAIRHVLQRRTGIIIAHRLATLQHVDDLLILEQGHMIEYGKREQLAQDPDSHYSRLLRLGLEEELA
ncbi:MAG TPA: ABC transporter ATP-binding protein [Ktedonobacterales bacterium]|nr:ABC transporter ATP-binding protein [Ktedonobacterales bacterium]